MMHLFDDETNNCASKIAWSSLFFFQYIGNVATMVSASIIIVQHSGSFFDVVANSFGVVILNENPTEIESVNNN